MSEVSDFFGVNIDTQKAPEDSDSRYVMGAIPIVGDAFRAKLAREEAERERRRQEQFARMGVRWKMEDAKAAGLHPLYALGAQTAMPSPVYSQEGEAIADMGQNISRAVMAGVPKSERDIRQLQLEGAALDNDLKRAQLAVLSQQLNPPGPGMVDVEPAKVTSHEVGRPAEEAGLRSDVSFSQGDDAIYPQIPTSLSESLEDDFIGKMNWRWRNQALPNVTGEGAPKKALPPGWRWNFDFWKQGWTPTRQQPRSVFQRFKEWIRSEPINRGKNIYRNLPRR